MGQVTIVVESLSDTEVEQEVCRALMAAGFEQIDGPTAQSRGSLLMSAKKRKATAMKSFTDITAQLGDHAATLRPHQSLVDEALQMQASGKLSGKPSDWVRSSLTTTPLVPLDASMEAALVALDKETAVRPESVLWPAGDAEIS